MRDVESGEGTAGARAPRTASAGRAEEDEDEEGCRPSSRAMNTNRNSSQRAYSSDTVSPLRVTRYVGFQLGSIYDSSAFVFVGVLAFVAPALVPVEDSFLERGKYWSRSSVGIGRGCRPVPGVTGEYHSDRPNST